MTADALEAPAQLFPAPLARWPLPCALATPTHRDAGARTKGARFQGARSEPGKGHQPPSRAAAPTWLPLRPVGPACFPPWGSDCRGAWLPGSGD